MPIKVKPPEPPKTQIRQAGDIAARMLQDIADIWKREVLQKMTMPSATGFTDALSPEDQKKYDRLAANATKIIREKFRKNKVAALTKDMLNKVDARNAAEMRQRIVEKSFGITAKEVQESTPKAFTKELFKQTEDRFSEIADGALNSYREESLKAIRKGGSLEDVMKRFNGQVEERKGQAKQNARTQIANFNSQVNTMRAKSLGITEAIWQTTIDGRERPSHADRDGKTFALKDGLYSSLDGLTLLPGEDYNCRCSMEMVIPE